MSWCLFCRHWRHVSLSLWQLAMHQLRHIWYHGTFWFSVVNFQLWVCTLGCIDINYLNAIVCIINCFRAELLSTWGSKIQELLLLTWPDLNPGVDTWLYPLQNVILIYLSTPKLQRCSRWSLEIAIQSSHALPGMRLFIHAWVKVNHFHISSHGVDSVIWKGPCIPRGKNCPHLRL